MLLALTSFLLIYTSYGIKLRTNLLVQMYILDESHSYLLDDDAFICVNGKSQTPQNTNTQNRDTSRDTSSHSSSANTGISSQESLLLTVGGPISIKTIPVEEMLAANNVPNQLFYVFCQQNKMWFHHYLAILSAIRHIQPEAITFYHDWSEPQNPNPYYNTFYQELKEEFPSFRSIQVNSDTACDGPMRPKKDFINCLLSEHGGMYVHETTMITGYPKNLRTYSFIDAYNAETGEGFLLAQRGLDVANHYADKDRLTKPADTRLKVASFRCRDNMTYCQAPFDQKPFCVNLQYSFFPRDIMTLDNDFGKLARQIFYNDTQIALPKPDSRELIPNIAHMVWIGGGSMNFLFYMGVLSLIYVAEVDHVYIHGDQPPTGEYWEKIKHNPKLLWIYRRPPRYVYGQPISVLSHISDVWRVELMIQYGGIYMDTDAVFVRKLTPEIRAYDAVSSLDSWPKGHPPYPDVINFGVCAGKRNAKFWTLFRETFSEYYDNDWAYNGLSRPYQVWERHPDLLLLDPHFTVSYTSLYICLCR